jgi:hypothetical protein
MLSLILQRNAKCESDAKGFIRKRQGFQRDSSESIKTILKKSSPKHTEPTLPWPYLRSIPPLFLGFALIGATIIKAVNRTLISQGGVDSGRKSLSRTLRISQTPESSTVIRYVSDHQRILSAACFWFFWTDLDNRTSRSLSRTYALKCESGILLSRER